MYAFIEFCFYYLQLNKLFSQDPLSALDAHVGKAVFQNVFQKPGKTRVLVTHALHFLPQVDYIYTIADGRIAERGTYSELMSNNGEFSQFLTEFGSKQEEEKKEEEIEVGEKKDDLDEKRRNATAGAGLMQAEERNTGAINWGVYKSYSAAGRGSVMLPLLFAALVLIQGATVMSSYWYVLSCDWHV
jgi:ABC-type methionine transport system ATPase subunit